MSVDNKNVIDTISLDVKKKVVLTISDHLDWDSENKHILILQDKINAYLNFIESGEIFESYPLAKDKLFVISVTLKYPPNAAGIDFLAKVEAILAEAKYEFSFHVIS